MGDVDVTFATPDEPDEFEVLREGVDPPPEDNPAPTPDSVLPQKLRGKTAQEVEDFFTELERKASGQDQLSQTLQSLQSTLEQGQKSVPKSPTAPAPAEPEVPDEPTEDDHLADPINTTKRIVAREVEKARREVGTALAQQAAVNLTLRKQLMEKDDEYFAKYKAEIEAELEALDPNVRYAPGALDHVVGMVKTRHQSDIITAEVQKKLAEEMTKNGKSGGIATPSTPSNPTEVRSTAGAAPRSGKRVYLTQAEQREALAMGLAVPDKNGNINYGDYIRYVKMAREQSDTKRVTA